MADTPTGRSAWTDSEKFSVVFQLLKPGKIDWNTISLPPGRTIKACQLMLDKEKAKVKKANDSTGGHDESPSIKSGKKRGAAAEKDTPLKKARAKPKAKAKTMAEVKKESEDEDEAEDNDEADQGYSFDLDG